MAERRTNSRAPLVLVRVLDPAAVLHGSTGKYCSDLAKRFQLAIQPTPQDIAAVGRRLEREPTMPEWSVLR